jgi:hypothetical protein
MADLELGQALLSNATWQEHDMPAHVEEAISFIASFHAEASGRAMRGEGAMDSNVGGAYRGPVFALRAYCWCEGDRHPDGCPPNFEFYPRGFKASWYKHLGRGANVNRVPSVRETAAMLVTCIQFIAQAPEDELSEFEGSE